MGYTLAIIGKVGAADMGGYFGELSLLRSESGLVETTSVEEWSIRRDSTLRIIEDTLGGIPELSGDFNWRVEDQEESEEFIRKKVFYSGEEGEEIPAHLLIPKGLTGPAPAVICIHGTTPYGKDVTIGLEGPASRAYGLELAKRGYVVLAPDLLTFGERILPGRRYVDTTDFYIRHPNWSMLGKIIFDISRAVDFLYTQGDIVDEDNIGAIGHSLGGHSAFFSAAFEQRIKVAVSSCGTYPFVEPSLGFRWSRKDPRNFIYIPKLRDYLICDKPVPFDLYEVMALIEPRPFLHIAADENIPGLGDMLGQMQSHLIQVYQLYHAEEKLGWHFYIGPHDFPEESRKMAYEWLDKWLR